MKLSSPSCTIHRPLARRGSITVALVVSLTVLLGVLALAIDWAFVNSAHVELSRAADAAALAGARALVHDHLLRGPCDPLEIEEAACDAARRFAGFNSTAGDPTDLTIGHDQFGNCDIHLGRVVRSGDGIGEFVETHPSRADTVEVTARRTGQRKNPVALLLGSILGVNSAEVVARSRASLDDEIVGFAPVCQVRVPVVPVAILARHHCDRKNTWLDAIERRGGSDCFRFDEKTCEVVPGSDGIPELELMAHGLEHDGELPDAALVRFCHHPRHSIRQQIETGLTASDLEALNGEVRLPDSGRLSLDGEFELPSDLLESFRKIRGQCRVWLLFEENEKAAATGCKLSIVGFVGARVMDVRRTEHGCLVVRVQPCFVVTRSAIVDHDGHHHKNKYIRKLSITG